MRRLSRLIAIGYFLICLATLALSTAVRGPLGYAPFPLPIGPARTPMRCDGLVWHREGETG